MRFTVTYTICLLAISASAQFLPHARNLPLSLVPGNASSNSTASRTPLLSLSSPTRPSQPSDASSQSLVPTTQASTSIPTSALSLISPSGFATLPTTDTNNLPSPSSQSSKPVITTISSSQTITTAPPPPSTTYAPAVVSSVTSQAADASAAAITFRQDPTLPNAQNSRKKIDDALTGTWLSSSQNPKERGG